MLCTEFCPIDTLGFFFLLAKCYVVHWLTTRDYDLLLQTSEQVVIFRRDGFVASVGYSHNTTHL